MSSDVEDARAAAAELIERYGQATIAEADVVVALGGDGFLLQTLRETMSTGKLVYGMNRGTIGFLMNEFRAEGLPDRIAAALPETIRPLEMETETAAGEKQTALAINEVALWRQSYQTAKIRITIDGKVRLDELHCDGVMVATPAGSTAYNLSAYGPILPLDAPLLALTPVSPFRPRRWRGALLSNKATVRFDMMEPGKRPVNAVGRPCRGEVGDLGHRAGVADEDRHAALRPRPFVERAHPRRAVSLLSDASNPAQD